MNTEQNIQDLDEIGEHIEAVRLWRAYRKEEAKKVSLRSQVKIYNERKKKQQQAAKWIDKQHKRKKVDKKVYQKRKKEIKITIQFRQKWKELRREYWKQREEWAARYNKCEYVNKWFDGCEQHHISKYLIVCIPKKLHRSIYHSLRSGKGMLRINDLVYEWLELQHLT